MSLFYRYRVEEWRGICKVYFEPILDAGYEIAQKSAIIGLW